ncbi:hypothetical protein CLIB1444_04S01354 [[Candida] jaroonii]|uniref:Uncharacterized protein n=1 Tax=[Candida] jaroonii TaxID=467808 RepID=A0ACA9Y678_9ASCO|nr:hypothetical protein CLIB1444_04S01354 [[Candida] jaroonii]
MEWIETPSGNRISVSSKLHNKENIQIKGNSTIGPGVELNALENEVSILIGKYCYLSENCHITPPLLKPGVYGQFKMGNYTIIGKDCILKAAAIGNRVVIESDCKVDELAIIYDCCIIRQGTIIPPKMIIPPFSEVRGVPGKNFKVSQLGTGYKRTIEIEAKELQILGM